MNPASLASSFDTSSIDFQTLRGFYFLVCCEISALLLLQLPYFVPKNQIVIALGKTRTPASVETACHLRHYYS